MAVKWEEKLACPPTSPVSLVIILISTSSSQPTGWRSGGWGTSAQNEAVEAGYTCITTRASIARNIFSIDDGLPVLETISCAFWVSFFFNFPQVGEFIFEMDDDVEGVEDSCKEERLNFYFFFNFFLSFVFWGHW